MDIFTNITSYFKTHFPGTLLEDPFHFFVIGKTQYVLEFKIEDEHIKHDLFSSLLSNDPLFIIATESDIDSCINTSTKETRTIEYNPDWSISEQIPQHLYECAGNDVDFEKLSTKNTDNIVCVNRGTNVVIITKGIFVRVYCNDIPPIQQILPSRLYNHLEPFSLDAVYAS